MENRGPDAPRARVYRRGDDRVEHSRVERPKRPPREREKEKFKELVEKDDEKKSGKDAKLNPAVSERQQREGKGQSIFDLSAESSEGDAKKAAIGDASGATRDPGAFNLLAGSDEPKKVAGPKAGEEGQAGKEAGQWAFPQQAASIENTAVAKGAVIRGSNMEELLKQITDELNILKQGDRTDTTFTLKHPPLFAGASVKITEFQSAKGEFNLTFHNLSAEAKALIDSQANQNLLRMGLESKGFALHIVNSTTEPAPIATAEADRGREDGQGQGQQQRDEQQEERKDRQQRDSRE